MSKNTISKAAQEESMGALVAMIKPGDTVYTMLRKVSASGMSRQISLFIVRDGAILPITGRVADVLGYKTTDKNPGGNWAIRVDGAGMDMGFHLVYNLGRVLFKGTDTEKDPGYSLSHRWL